MKVNEITITIKPSIQIKEYNAVDIIIETSAGKVERHELLPTNDLISKLDNMYEMVKKELLILEKEYDEIYC